MGAAHYARPPLSLTRLARPPTRPQVYHEATLTNLLEVAFYHEHVVESLDDDLTLELVDYCVRKVSWLLGLPRDALTANTTFHKSGDEIVQLLRAQCGSRRELARQQLEIEFRLAVQCVTLLRYVAERLHLLPLSIVSRLLDKHDVLLALAALVENPPWTHKALVPADDADSERTEVVKWTKFVNQKWVVVAPSDLLVLTPTEAQVWLAVYYLLCTKSAREHYEVTSFRKNQLLRIRKYLNDLLLDQLPLLADVQRYLDELSIMQVGSSGGGTSSGRGGGLIMEAVPYLRVAIARKFGTKYSSVAAHFDALSASISRDDDLRELAEVYQMEGIDELLDGDDSHRCVEPTSAPSAPPPPTVARFPRRVTLVFHDRLSEPKTATKTPLIVEIDTSDAGLHNDADRGAQTTPTKVVVECAVDAASRKEMETKTHRYARYALRVVATDDSNDKGGVTVACRAAAKAQIWFDSVDEDDNDNVDNDNVDNATPAVTLECPDLQLPTPSSQREKLWTQLGSLQDASLVVVQCQFIATDPSNQAEADSDTAVRYRLGALFLSVPC